MKVKNVFWSSSKDCTDVVSFELANEKGDVLVEVKDVSFSLAKKILEMQGVAFNEEDFN